jgi:bifunctional non-homologous end joining protein LigD
MPLNEYRARRDFGKTDEPSGDEGGPKPHPRPIFVVQEHHASHLHYDFRLEANGVLKSWAVPKQPTLDPSRKRLAVQVEDHPLGYATFQGTIPQGQYGAGTVSIWDHGTYRNLIADAPTPRDVAEAIDDGRLEFALEGEKLRGKFALIRMKGRGRGKPQWLLIKMKDEFARAEFAADRPKAGTKPTPTPEPKPKAAAPTRSGAAPPRVIRGSTPSGKKVELTHPDKVLFPDAGLTKRDVFAYYEQVADRLLPYLKDRPATLERLPEGLAGNGAPHFWQKDTPAHYPTWIPRVALPTGRGKTVHYALVNDVETLLYLVNQGTLSFHVWASRVEDLDRPDFVLFDLDPGAAAFADAIAVARSLHAILDDMSVKSFVKTSGKTGLHILTPSIGKDYTEARSWALAIAERAAAESPGRATVQIRKAKRAGRLYIDVLQNARGHHAVPPYVLRAVPAATVSMPLTWKELTPDLDPGRFTLRSAPRRLAERRADPLAGLLRRIKRGSLG